MASMKRSHSVAKCGGSNMVVCPPVTGTMRMSGYAAHQPSSSGANGSVSAARNSTSEPTDNGGGGSRRSGEG